jgi:hypothetical protein
MEFEPYKYLVGRDVGALSEIAIPDPQIKDVRKQILPSGEILILRFKGLLVSGNSVLETPIIAEALAQLYGAPLQSRHDLTAAMSDGNNVNLEITRALDQIKDEDNIFIINTNSSSPSPDAAATQFSILVPPLVPHSGNQPAETQDQAMHALLIDGRPNIIDVIADIHKKLKDSYLIIARSDFAQGELGEMAFRIVLSGEPCGFQTSNGICNKPPVGTIDFDAGSSFDFAPHCEDHGNALSKAMASSTGSYTARNGHGRTHSGPPYNFSPIFS